MIPGKYACCGVPSMRKLPSAVPQTRFKRSIMSSRSHKALRTSPNNRMKLPDHRLASRSDRSVPW